MTTSSTVILVLGTDASGKDYFSRLLEATLARGGRIPEKRRGWFCGRACTAASSEDKSWLRLVLERLFLATYPVFGWLLPPLLTLSIHADRLAFRPASRGLLVVSHTPLRLLAFHLAHAATPIPDHTRRALRALRSATRCTTLVLTSTREVRTHRIQDRIKRGRADHFDLYMATNQRQADRVAQALVSIAQDCFDATLIHNNTDGPDDIQRALDRLAF